jgi:hypothetical protein
MALERVQSPSSELEPHLRARLTLEDVVSMNLPVRSFLEAEKYLQGEMSEEELVSYINQCETAHIPYVFREPYGTAFGMLDEGLRRIPLESSLYDSLYDKRQAFTTEVLSSLKPIMDLEQPFIQRTIDLLKLFVEPKSAQAPLTELQKKNFQADYLQKRLSPEEQSIYIQQGNRLTVAILMKFLNTSDRDLSN